MDIILFLISGRWLFWVLPLPALNFSEKKYLSRPLVFTMVQGNTTTL